MTSVHSFKKVIRLLIVPLLFTVLYGCTSGNQYNELMFEEIEKTPTVLTSPADKQGEQGSKPKLAIAFGGGAARGMMHLGVIKALNEAGIKADIVTGTSVGSIAATLYSCNTYPEIERKMFEFTEHEIVDISLSRAGLIKGKALAKWVNEQTGYDDLRDLPITTGIVATNLTQKKAVMFTKGNIGRAVQTSSSVPGVFVPVHYNNEILVDGGILSLVPVYAARQLGADIVIAVDVFCSLPPPLKYNAIDAMANTFWLQSCVATKDEIDSADIVIWPVAPDPSLVNFGGMSERTAATMAGYEAMKKALPLLKQHLSI
ncbi:patatin-like phospholipase family protein [Vibrio sp. FJH11]